MHKRVDLYQNYNYVEPSTIRSITLLQRLPNDETFDNMRVHAIHFAMNKNDKLTTMKLIFRPYVIQQGHYVSKQLSSERECTKKQRLCVSQFASQSADHRDVVSSNVVQRQDHRCGCSQT